MTTHNYENYVLEASKAVVSKMAYMTSKNLNYNWEWEQKTQELYIINRMNYIHDTYVGKGFVPVFITLTLPSEYHELKQDGRSGALVPNPKFAGHSVHQGYKYLLKAFRSLYKEYKRRVDGKHVQYAIKYSRVVEPHKDGTAHLHAVIYVQDAKHFRKHFDSVVSFNKLNQVDFEVLSKTKHSLTYLLKYVAKTIGGKNAYIMGWKKVNRIVMVRTSNAPFTRIEYMNFIKNVPYSPAYPTTFHHMEEELKVFRHTSTMDKHTAREHFSKADLSRFILLNCKTKSVGSDSPKYVFHSVGAYLLDCDVVEVEYEEPLDGIFSVHERCDMFALNDDILGLPMYHEEEDGSFVPVCDEYEFQYDDVNGFEYHKFNHRSSYRIGHLEFIPLRPAPLAPFYLPVILSYPSPIFDSLTFYLFPPLFVP